MVRFVLGGRSLFVEGKHQVRMNLEKIWLAGEQMGVECSSKLSILADYLINWVFGVRFLRISESSFACEVVFVASLSKTLMGMVSFNGASQAWEA